MSATHGQRLPGPQTRLRFDVLTDGAVVGRIMKVQAAPVGSPWMWTLASGHQDRTPTHGYAATREAAMAAFAKSWRRE
jgi:hypothetical protein